MSLLIIFLIFVFLSAWAATFALYFSQGLRAWLLHVRMRLGSRFGPDDPLPQPEQKQSISTQGGKIVMSASTQQSENPQAASLPSSEKQIIGAIK